MIQNAAVDDHSDKDDDSMKMLKSTTWQQAFHCVTQYDGVEDHHDAAADDDNDGDAGDDGGADDGDGGDAGGADE